jgi:hypothetical protein
MEDEISLLLSRSGAAAHREQLLGRLSEYSNSATREARTLGAIVPQSAECTQALSWLQRPVLICGHHRTGTTLLQNLLDGHPQLLSLPSEGTYFTSFAYVAGGAPADSQLNRFAAEWITRFVDPNFEPHFRLGRSVSNRSPAVDFARALFGWNKALRSRVPREFVPLLALVAAFKSTTAPASTPLLWVEKTPRNERYVARFDYFRAARFIHLIRDPRATLASLNEIYRTANIGSFDAAESARTIAQSLHLAQRNPPRIANRYLVMRYEDLVERPALQINRVREFLGITRDARLLVPTAAGRPVCANSAFGKGCVGTVSVSRTSALLSAKHLALLGLFAGNQARPFGYHLAVPALTKRVAMRFRQSLNQVLKLACAFFRNSHLWFR